MPAFTAPFDPAAVSGQPELVVTLRDPARVLGDPLVRPGVARYAGKTLVLLHVNAGSGFGLVAPAPAAARAIDLEPGTLPGIGRLLELSPLPFAIAPVLRALRGGLPTFYVGAPSMTLPDDDALLEGGTSLATVTEAVVGVMFQDGVTLAPWAWIEVLRAAMDRAGDAAGAAAWGGLAALNSGVRSLRVLDHAGRPLAGAAFDIRIRRADATFEGPFTRVTTADGDLERAAAASPLPRASGPQASLFGSPAERTELRWASSSPLEGTALLVHALYETGASAPPSAGAILLPAGTERAHLQVLELANWFAPYRAATSSQLRRFREGNRVEPLVDGVDTFERIVDDLLASAAPGCGAHFTGLLFMDFPIQPGRLDGNGTPVDTHLTALTRRIMDAGGGARFLPHKWVNVNEEPDDVAKLVAVQVLLLAKQFTLVVSALGLKRTDTIGFFVVLGGSIAASALIYQFLSVTDLAESMVEGSREIVPALNAIDNNIAIWAYHPARIRDNPVGMPLPLGLEQYVDKFGSWHQKLQLIKRPAEGGGEEFVAYLGGIDINPNRIDTPSHQIAGPYHDVHARVTGPAAADVFLTWHERWAFHRDDPAHPVEGPTPDPAFDPPEADTLAEQPARHLVQIGRTYPRGHPDDEPLLPDFAPNGDTSTYETMLRAIKQAREYIYIEDQYFTPNDSHPPGSADTYFDALLAAAADCKRLAVLIPAESDQIFGDLRRRDLIRRLRQAWGDRFLIGTALRRHVLPDPGRIASEGRCYLMEPLGMPGPGGLSTIVLGSAARVPDSFPYWIWIDGELMLTAGQPYPMTVLDLPCKAVDVLRGPAGTDPRWGSTPRLHHRFAPATLAQLKAIYVHAKVTMIDDVFVTIGTSNINRRGFFYDGEINVFAVPEQLRAATDNPARALRTALWAEQLNLPPAMGPALLRDPIAAFDLFRRSRLEGGRFTPFEALDLKPYLGIPIGDGVLFNLLGATAIEWGEDQVPIVWNDVVDPTSFADEQPVPGPLPS